MYKHTLKTIALFILLFGCEDEGTQTMQAQELEQLEQMLEEIYEISESVTCTNSNSWTYTSFGSKACGGPQGFIAYSTDIDVEEFLKKVEIHKNAEKKFNLKWGIISDCRAERAPKAISCEDGNASFNY